MDQAYQALLKDRGIQVSMSSVGSCHDNAALEPPQHTERRDSPQPRQTAARHFAEGNAK